MEIEEDETLMNEVVNDEIDEELNEEFDEEINENEYVSIDYDEID